MTEHFDYPQELIDSIKNNKLIVFLGAGPSTSCGLPSWLDIVVQTLKQKSEYIDNSDIYIQNLNVGILSPLEVLDKLINNKKVIYNSFEEQLKNKEIRSDLHTALGQLTKKFITTNFDNLIEHNLNIKDVITKDSDFNLSKIDTNDSFVLKPHGDISQIDKCIIFSEEYEELYADEKFSTFQLKKLFSEYSLLFIGFSFSDPYVTELFNYISNLTGGYGPKHYLISNEDKQIENINTIVIDSYKALVPFIQGLIPQQKTVTSISEIPEGKTIHHHEDGSDVPPDVINWVGREKELTLLNNNTFKVIFITGIGGEGKSALASHYMNTVPDEEFELINWRDFKEEDHKFQHKIIAMILSVATNYEAANLAGLNDEELVNLFFLNYLVI